MEEKVTIYHIIDRTSEKLLLKISEQYLNFQQFETSFQPFWIESELALEGMVSKESDEYQNYDDQLKRLWEEFYLNRYELILNRELLERINYILTGEDGVRGKNIVHRNVLHQIADHSEISKELDRVFTWFQQEQERPILERYAYLLHGLMGIFPFFNGISVRFFCNLFITQHEYLPVVITGGAKSKYFYNFQFPFKRFKKAFFPLVQDELELVRLKYLK